MFNRHFNYFNVLYYVKHLLIDSLLPHFCHPSHISYASNLIHLLRVNFDLVLLEHMCTVDLMRWGALQFSRVLESCMSVRWKVDSHTDMLVTTEYLCEGISQFHLSIESYGLRDGTIESQEQGRFVVIVVCHR